MIKYTVVTPSPETRRLCVLALQIAGMKLGVETVPLVFVRENPEGRIEKPWRIRGAMEPDARGDVHFFLNVNQSPEALVRTTYHEVRHLKTLIDYLDRGQGPTSEINEAQAEFFARTEAPKGENYQTLIKALLCDGAETALENDSPEWAIEFATMLQEYDPQLAESLHRRAAALDRLNAGWVSTAARAARLTARNRRAARELQQEVAARRRAQEIAGIGERVREVAARAARRERSSE